MKYLFIIAVLATLIFSNCKKHEPEEMYLNIYSTDWYTDTFMINNNTFRGIYLAVSGKSNAGLLSIETTGDGLKGCMEINRDIKDEFNTEIRIRFYPIGLSDPQQAHTVVTAYSSSIKPEIVWCDAMGSGSTIRKEFESPLFTKK